MAWELIYIFGILYKGNNFFDVLFAFLHNKHLRKRDLLYQERNVLFPIDSL